MIGLIIFGISVLAILYVIMMGMMIIFERDKPKNIIIWSIVFLVTQIVGYIIYIAIRNVFYKKRNSLKTKQREDEIYYNLVSNKLQKNKVQTDQSVFEFNSLAFKANVTADNNYEIINDYAILKENLIEDINAAKKYIYIELTKVNRIDFESIKAALIAKANENIQIKLVYDRSISSKLIKELKNGGVKVYRFSNHNTIGKVYSNLRNIITIDGEVCYFANFNLSKRQLSGKDEVANMFLKVRGSIVQDIDLSIRKDVIFASGKFIEYNRQAKQEFNNNCLIQYVANEANTDLELVLIKAICSAKKSLQMQLGQFIPTESIMSLLRFAINSNIDVKLMIPIKNSGSGKYFASRAYAKQLALYGANVYLFDGFIKFNAITIDEEYVICGSFIVDREHLNTSPQNMLLIKDNKAVKRFNKMFESGIENSYRISNAKYMLMREKFFKNFV